MDTTAFYNLLLDQLSTGSLDNLIRVGAEFIHQHIVLLDPSYRVLSSWPHEKIGDPYWDAQQEHGFVPEDNLHKIFENRCPDATFNGPTYITWSGVVCPRSAASIHHNGMLLGHVSVYHTDNSLRKDEIQEACSCLEHILKIFLINNSHISTASSTVMSALVSKIFTGQHINQKFKDEWRLISGEEFKGGFVIATISQQKLHKSILELMGVRLNSIHKCFAYAEIEKYSYILFYNISSPRCLQGIISRFNDYLVGYKLSCGISDLFYNIDDVQFHMYQSRKALKLGSALHSEDLFHVYGNLRTDIILSYVCENMDCKNYTHPLFHKLQTEDIENRTQYYNTLSVYLDCMCDSAKAAKKLFIHRNTLLYRINHIEETYNCKMSDESFLKDIMLSHMVCTFHDKQVACEISQKSKSEFW